MSIWYITHCLVGVDGELCARVALSLLLSSSIWLVAFDRILAGLEVWSTSAEHQKMIIWASVSAIYIVKCNLWCQNEARSSVEMENFVLERFARSGSAIFLVLVVAAAIFLPPNLPQLFIDPLVQSLLNIRQLLVLILFLFLFFSVPVKLMPSRQVSMAPCRRTPPPDS